MARYLLSLVFCIGTGVACAAPLAPLRALQRQGAQISALVIRLNSSRILAQLHPGQALTPASISKLYVTAASLAQWGPQYRFTTRLVGAGSIRGDTLHGNLVLLGGGAPALTNQQLWRLAQRLEETKIRRVTGSLVVNESLFGRLGCTTKDRCEAEKTSANAYNARLGAAVADFGTATVVVLPGRVAGRPARVALEPFRLKSLSLTGRVMTAASGSPWSVRVWRTDLPGGNLLHVSGKAPAGSRPHRFYRAVADPVQFTGQTLKAFLSNDGISVKGGIVKQYRPLAGGVTLAQIHGQPLWILLHRMLTWSNNFMADTLALDLLSRHQSPPLNLTEAGELLTREGRTMEQTAPVMRGHHPKVTLFSGSGLTTDNRVSALDVVALLQALYHRYGLFPNVLGALTVPQYTPVPMLKTVGDHAWMVRIAAKTGSLNHPHSVFGLAGYLRLPKGGWGAFCILINGRKNHPVGLEAAIDATRRALSPFLRQSARVHRPAA